MRASSFFHVRQKKGIFPECRDDVVDALLGMYGLNGSAKFRLFGFETVISSRSKSLSNPVSFAEFFKRYCDLQRPMSVNVLKKLPPLCDATDARFWR